MAYFKFLFIARTFLILIHTEGDEARGVGIDGLKEFGHVDIGHAQRGAQKSPELLPRDPLIFIYIEQLTSTSHKNTAMNLLISLLSGQKPLYLHILIHQTRYTFFYSLLFIILNI